MGGSVDVWGGADVAFGPPGGGKEENVSVVKSRVQPGFSLQVGRGGQAGRDCRQGGGQREGGSERVKS